MSIASNIAEGFKRRSKQGKIRFLNIAQGSLEESRYYLILAQDLRWADARKAQLKLEELSKLPEGYRKAIQRSSQQ